MTETELTDVTETMPALKTNRKTSVPMLIFTFIGIWLLIEQLAGFDNIRSHERYGHHSLSRVGCRKSH